MEVIVENSSSKLDKLLLSLLKAQKAFKPIKKGGYNEYYKSHYSRLSDIDEGTRDALLENDLTLVHKPIGNGDLCGSETILYHVSGQFLSTKLMLKPKENTPQANGSVISYVKRFNATGLLNIKEDDDDAHYGTHSTSSTTQAPNDSFFGVTRSPSPAVGSYVVKFGKYKDKMLAQLTEAEIIGYISYLKSAAAKDGKPLSPPAKEFIDEGAAYLREGLPKNLASEPKSDIPDLTDSDLPF